MFVQQTVMSAAIIIVLGGSAFADPGGDGRGYFQIGAGYHTDDGFIATAAVDQPSLFHTGIELGEFAAISQRRTMFDLKLDVPGLVRFDLYNEGELPVGHGLSLEGFVDYARISNLEVESPSGLAHASGMAIGYGVIWHSPIGPLHVDLAYPGGGPPTWFIAFGP